jgi:hypothetical protein
MTVKLQSFYLEQVCVETCGGFHLFYWNTEGIQKRETLDYYTDSQVFFL